MQEEKEHIKNVLTVTPSHTQNKLHSQRLKSYEVKLSEDKKRTL